MSKINSKVQILKTNLNTYTTCQTHTHTHTGKTKYPQHILQTHRKHIQNIKSKQKHIQTIYSFDFFDMLYKYFFPCIHHKRNIFHFLIVAFPLGGPPSRTSGRQSHWGTPGFQVRFNVDPTGDAKSRGLRPNRRSSGSPGAKATGTLLGSKLGATSTQRETQSLEDFDPTGEAPGLRAPKPLGHSWVPSQGRRRPNGRRKGSRTSTQQGKLRAGPPGAITWDAPGFKGFKYANKTHIPDISRNCGY